MTAKLAVEYFSKRLAAIPPKADAALVIRHAEREEIPAETFGVDVPLTRYGAASAERLGATLASLRPVFEVTTSPVPRCVQTAEAILRGGGQEGTAAPDWRLGDPGPFVIDTERSGPFFLNTDISEIANRQLTNAEPPPGMRETHEGVRLLLDLAARDLGNRGHLNVYVTHDAILAVLVAYLFGLPTEETGWPNYLEGLLLWRGSEHLNFAWRGLEQASTNVGDHYR